MTLDIIHESPLSLFRYHDFSLVLCCQLVNESGQDRYLKQYERFTIGEKIEKYIETEKHLLIYSKSDESNKELRELKTKVSRLEELLSEKGINLT